MYLITLGEKENNILSEFWNIEPGFYTDSAQFLNKNYRKQLIDIIHRATEVYEEIKVIVNNI